MLYTNSVNYRYLFLEMYRGYVSVPVLRIRILFRSAFSNFVDPDPYSENESGSTQLKIGKETGLTDKI